MSVGIYWESNKPSSSVSISSENHALKILSDIEDGKSKYKATVTERTNREVLLENVIIGLRRQIEVYESQLKVYKEAEERGVDNQITE